jgi:hypothetical protein
MEGLERMVGDVLARYGVVAAQTASVAVERENEQFALRHESLVRAIAGIPELDQPSGGGTESVGLESAA